MASVRRDGKGEITHILIDGRYYAKDDAARIMYGEITENDLSAYIAGTPSGGDVGKEMSALILGLLNESETLYRTKARILRRLKKIGDPE